MKKQAGAKEYWNDRRILAEDAVPDMDRKQARTASEKIPDNEEKRRANGEFPAMLPLFLHLIQPFGDTFSGFKWRISGNVAVFSPFGTEISASHPARFRVRRSGGEDRRFAFHVHSPPSYSSCRRPQIFFTNSASRRPSANASSAWNSAFSIGQCRIYRSNFIRSEPSPPHLRSAPRME